MTIIFVHGIFSSCKVFEKMREVLTMELTNATFIDFEYPYLESIESNAKALNKFLDEQISENSEVAIVAHSMGGLVSRMALLIGQEFRPYQIKYLIMLATPNHGAMKLGQLRGLAAFARQEIGKIPFLYSRSRGLSDLTQVNTIVNSLLSRDKRSVLRTQSTDYVTIPSTFYSEENPYNEEFSKVFKDKILDFMAFLSAHQNSVKLNYAHDGIVEEKSVRMVTENGHDLNERTYFASVDGREFLGRSSYVHIVIPDCQRGNHVQIHSIPAICNLVADIIRMPGIGAWLESLNPEDRSRMMLLH